MYLGIYKGAVGDAAECGAHRVLYCAAFGVDATTREVSNMGMKRILAALLLLTLAAPAWGQDYEKGMQAYDRGDYTVKMR